jgi:MFS family permease
MLVFSITRVLGMFGRRMAFTYASLYILTLGGEPEQIGLVNSLRPLTALLVFPVGGYLADNAGRVKLIGWTGIFSGLVFLLYVLAPSWHWLAWAALLRGFTVISFPASSALIADSLAPQDRGRGLAVMNTISSTPAMFAPYLAGAILEATSVDAGMRYLYAFLAAASMVSSLISFRFLRETAQRPRQGLGLANLTSLLRRSFADVPRTLLGLPQPVRTLALVIGLAFVANALAGPFWVVFAVQRIGLSSAQWGSILLVETALRNVLYLPAGVLVDRFGRARCMHASLLLATLTVPLFVHAEGFLTVLLVRAGVATANAFFSPASGALLADLVPREKRGRVMAAIGRGSVMLGSTGGGIGGPSLGFLMAIPLTVTAYLAGHLYSYNATYPWYAGCTALLLCTVVAVPRISDPRVAHA